MIFSALVFSSKCTSEEVRHLSIHSQYVAFFPSARHGPNTVCMIGYPVLASMLNFTLTVAPLRVIPPWNEVYVSSPAVMIVHLSSSPPEFMRNMESMISLSILTASVLSSLGHLREYLGKQQTVDYLFTLLSVLLKSVAAEHVQVHSCTGLEPESTPPSFEIEQQRKCRQVLQPALIPYAHPLHVENGHYTSVVHANCYSLSEGLRCDDDCVHHLPLVDQPRELQVDHCQLLQS